MISFVGGTGPEGLGLAFRFLLAGEDVTIGSRQLDRAAEAAHKLRDMLDSRRSQGLITAGTPYGLKNIEAVEAGDIVFITVPYAAHAEILAALRVSIAEKLVVDTVVPVRFENGTITALPVKEGSAAEQAQKILPRATVVSAFQNLSAETLLGPNEKLDGTVVVCGDDKDAKAKVMDLATRIEGIHAVDGGRLANSRYVEDFTTLLLNINKIYKAHSSLKIVGL